MIRLGINEVSESGQVVSGRWRLFRSGGGGVNNPTCLRSGVNPNRDGVGGEFRRCKGSELTLLVAVVSPGVMKVVDVGDGSRSVYVISRAHASIQAILGGRVKEGPVEGKPRTGMSPGSKGFE